MLVELAETFANLPFLFRVEVKFLEQRGIVVVPGIDDLGVLGWHAEFDEFGVESVFVVSADFAVHADEEGFITERFDLFAVVSGDEPGHLLDPFPAFEKVFQGHCPLEDFIQFFDVGDAIGLGEGEKFRVLGLVRY